jgi:hypothetical protein
VHVAHEVEAYVAIGDFHGGALLAGVASIRNG